MGLQGLRSRSRARSGSTSWKRRRAPPRAWELFVDAVPPASRRRRASPTRIAARLQGQAGALACDRARPARRRDRANTETLVEEEPSDEEAVSALDKLLRSEDRRDDLRWLFELRATQGAEDARAAILTEWASLEQDVFGEPSRATDLYRRVLEADATNELAARTLPRLLLAGGNAEEAAEVIEAHREQSEGEARAERELELAGIYLDQALEAGASARGRSARAQGRAARPARDGVARSAARACRRPAARRPSCSSRSTPNRRRRRRAQALGVLLETSTDAERRLELYTALADIEEHKLSAAGRAFEVMLRALTEFPGEIALWGRAAVLAAARRSPDRSRGGLPRVALPRKRQPSGGVEIELCERAAALHDEKLGDPEAATPYLERMLERRPGDDRAFTRLKQILTSAEQWGELEELYDAGRQGHHRRPAPRRSAQRGRARLRRDHRRCGQGHRLLREHPRPRSAHENATRALEKLYAREGSTKSSPRCSSAGSRTATQAETVDLKVRARPDRSRSAPRSARALWPPRRGAAARRRDNSEARQLVERMLEIGSLRTRAAEVLEAVYEARDEVRELVRVLEIRLEGATRRPICGASCLRRIASVCATSGCATTRGAFDTLAGWCRSSPTDVTARERMSEIGRRLGAHERVAARARSPPPRRAKESRLRSEILMQVAAAREDMLGDLARAEAVYKPALAIDPNDPELALPPGAGPRAASTGIGQSRALAEILGSQVALEDEHGDAPRALGAPRRALRDGARGSRTRHRGLAIAPRRRADGRAALSSRSSASTSARRPGASSCARCERASKARRRPTLRRRAS